MSREPGQPGGVLDHEGERREVAPRPVEAEARHPHHDEIGSIGPERLVVEPELVQHPWRVVLDDHVARGHELAHQIEATRISWRSSVRPFLLMFRAAKIGPRSQYC